MSKKSHISDQEIVQADEKISKIKSKKISTQDLDLKATNSVSSTFTRTQNSSLSHFLKSSLGLLFIVSALLVVITTSLFVTSSLNFREDTQAQFARINQELAAIKSLNTDIAPAPKQNLTNSKLNPIGLGVEKPNLTFDNFSGDLNSRFVLVVYVDMECPFCKIMHQNLIKLQREIPSLAIVYRHFPLEQIHPNALVLAQATECSKQIQGQAAFWKLTNSIFNNQNLLNYPSGLLKIVQNSGLDAVSIEQCVKNGDTLNKVRYDQQEAIDKLGSKNLGTPTSILFENGLETGVVINGAVDYQTLKKVITESVR